MTRKFDTDGAGGSAAWAPELIPPNQVYVRCTVGTIDELSRRTPCNTAIEGESAMACARIMKSRTNALTLLALLVAGSFTALSPASAQTVISTDLGGYRGGVLRGSVYGDRFFDGYSEPLDWDAYFSPFGNAGDFAGNSRVLGPTRGFFERMFDKDEHRALAPQVIETRQSIMVPVCPNPCD